MLGLWLPAPSDVSTFPGVLTTIFPFIVMPSLSRSPATEPGTCRLAE